MAVAVGASEGRRQGAAQGWSGIGRGTDSHPRTAGLPHKVLFHNEGDAPWTVFPSRGSSRSNPAPGPLRPATTPWNCAASPRCCSRPGSSNRISPATTAPRPWDCRAILKPSGSGSWGLIESFGMGMGAWGPPVRETAWAAIGRTSPLAVFIGRLGPGWGAAAADDAPPPLARFRPGGRADR